MTIWIQITSGRGPEECCRAVWLALHVLLRELEENRLEARLLDAHPGDRPGTLHSALVAVDGSGADAVVARWRGTLQWISPSPYRPKCGRKNWFIRIDTFQTPREITFRESDLSVETMRASGPGGQHVNKTESAVRMTHLPTGLTATAAEERSQFLNRKLALARLAALIAARNASLQQAGQQQRWQTHNTLERGNPARVFKGVDFTPI